MGAVKLHEEPRLTVGLALMQHLWHGDPRALRIEQHLSLAEPVDAIAEPPGDNVVHAPHTGSGRTVFSQAARDRALVELSRSLVRDPSVGHLEPIAAHAREELPSMAAIADVGSCRAASGGRTGSVFNGGTRRRSARRA